MNKHSMSYRKFIASAAAVAVVAPVVAPIVSMAASFPDVTEKTTHAEAILALVDAGIIKGNTDGTFKPDAQIKRGDAAVMIARALKLLDGTIPSTMVTDLGNSNAVTQEAVAKLVNKGIVSGFTDKTFRPNETVTRGQMAKYVANAYNLPLGDGKTNFPDVDSSSDLAKYIDAIAVAGITKGNTNGTFGFGDNLKRGDFAAMVYRAENLKVAPVVEGVIAKNTTQVELTGTGLAQLVKEDISIEGNTVNNIEFDKVTGKAVVTFAKPFASGKEQTLVFTNEEDVEKEFTFTYTIVVSSLEATSTRVDDNTDKQFLGFTINGGESVSVQYLLDSGYKVDFQATNNSVLEDAKTGELKEAALLADFAYKVVVSKDDVKVESELSDVEVLDFATYMTNINEVTVDQGDVSVKSGKVTVQDGTVNIAATKATVLNGATINNPTVTYKSSNPAVASVNAKTGAVTPIKAGNVTITVEADEASYSLPLTVVSGAREATTATTTTASVKLLKGKTKDVDFTVVDQYGDEFEGTLDVVSRDAAIAKGSAETLTFKDGEVTGTLSAIAKGNTVIDLKKGTTTLKSVDVSISDDAVVASRKVETSSPSADLALDVVAGTTDGTVGLVWNQYNADGFLIGAEKNYTNDDVKGTTYTVSSSDEKVATVEVSADGTINVTGKSKGTANVVIKEGTVTRATAKVTVNDSTPTITAVKFEEVKDVATEGALNAQALKAEGITLSSTDYKAEIAANGTIFIDVKGSTEGLDNKDIKLGAFDAIYSGPQTDITDLAIEGGSVKGNVVAGAEGTIVARVVLNGKTEAFATSTINVKVPK